MEQPDGSYPRLNGQLLQSGGYNEMIVSLVGTFDTTHVNPTLVSSIEKLPYTKFSCCDGCVIELNTEHATPLSPEVMAVANGMVFELIGQVQGSSTLTVRFTQLCGLSLERQGGCYLYRILLHSHSSFVPSSFLKTFIL
jgi:hypothetical protein